MQANITMRARDLGTTDSISSTIVADPVARRHLIFHVQNTRLCGKLKNLTDHPPKKPPPQPVRGIDFNVNSLNGTL
jgi:hypothetical protein